MLGKGFPLCFFISCQSFFHLVLFATQSHQQECTQRHIRHAHTHTHTYTHVRTQNTYTYTRTCRGCSCQRQVHTHTHCTQNTYTYTNMCRGCSCQRQGTYTHCTHTHTHTYTHTYTHVCTQNTYTYTHKCRGCSCQRQGAHTHCTHTHTHTHTHTKYIHIHTHMQGVQLSAAGGRLVQEDGKNEIEHPRAGDGETPQGLPFGGGIRGGLEGRGGMLHGNGSGEREGEGEGARADVSSLLPAPPEEPLHPLSALTKATPSQLLQWQVRVSWLSEFLCAAVLIVRLCIPCLRCCSGRCGFRGFQSSSVQL